MFKNAASFWWCLITIALCMITIGLIFNSLKAHASTRMVCEPSALASELCHSGSWMDRGSCTCLDGLVSVAVENPLNQRVSVGCAKLSDRSALMIAISIPIRNELAYAFTSLHRKIQLACVDPQIQDKLGPDCGALPFATSLHHLQLKPDAQSIKNAARFHRAIHRRIEPVSTPANAGQEL